MARINPLTPRHNLAAAHVVGGKCHPHLAIVPFAVAERAEFGNDPHGAVTVGHLDLVESVSDLFFGDGADTDNGRTFGHGVVI